jgi:cholesterol 24(S)-hydroxylase
VLGGRDYVEFDDLAKLKYLGQVLEEALRKYPVAPAPSRVLAKDITVGGYHIPKGNGINSLQILFSMNPEIWENPEVFDPEKFSDAKNIPNFSMIHFPFSIGPRNCIGQTFAKFESKVILAKLLQKFQFRLLPGQTNRVKARLTSTPRDGVMSLDANNGRNILQHTKSILIGLLNYACVNTSLNTRELKVYSLSFFSH